MSRLAVAGTVTTSIAAMALTAVVAPMAQQDARAVLTAIQADAAPAAARDGAVSGWIPFWNFTAAHDSFARNADLFSEVYAFFHEVDGRGNISTYATRSQLKQLRRTAAEAGVPLYGTILDASGKGEMARILGNDHKRKRHIRDLVRLAETQGYDGIDIDYENFAFADNRSSWPRTRRNWVQFMKELSGALHDRGLLLSTATPASYDGRRGDSSGYWVYDWEGIEPYVDRVGVMTYDFSYNTAGPTSPRPWFDTTTEYAVEALGDKASMGVPAYGYDWSRCEGRDSITQRQALRLAERKDRTVRTDRRSGEARFSYRTGKCKHTVWFGDPRMLGERVAGATDAGAGGIAIWALGSESRATWQSIREATG